MSTIKVDVSSSKKPVLQVGYQEENEVTDVLFDISAWVEEYGGGTAGLRVKRPQNSEEESYELSLPISENVATWTVSETDTYNRGNGKVQLKYYVGSALKESAVYTYKVGKSIVGSDNPVDPFDTWIERSKAWATGELLDGEDVPASDETYHNNAKYYAEQSGAQAEEAETQAVEAKAQADTAKQYAHQFVGAPRAASTAAGMTDHDLVYVFTGTTTSSLTNGHWYYWNGSAWADGGVYNSTAFTTDTTLSVSGAAADAKVAGDLKSDMEQLYAEASLSDIDSYDLESGYYSSSDGTKQSSASFIRAKRLYRIDGGFYYYSATGSQVRMCLYDANLNFIKHIYVNSKTGTTKTFVPTNAVYCGLFISASASVTSHIEIIKWDSSSVELCEYPFADDNYSFIPNNYMGADGVIRSASTLSLIVLYNVKAGDKYYVSNTADKQGLCTDSSGSLITATKESVAPYGQIITVPSGTKAMHFNIYNADIEGTSDNLNNYIAKVTQDKKILCIGDSITWLDGRGTYGDSAHLKGYQAILRKAGYEVVSAGYSGYPYADLTEVYADYGIHKQIVTNAVDVSSYDIAILFGGANDLLHSSPLGDASVDYSNPNIDGTTFNGAIGGIIKYIRQNNPTCKIYICTMLPSEAFTRSYATNKVYRDAVIQNGEFWQVPVIDMYTLMNVHPTINFSDYFYDVTHPNADGMEIIGGLMLKALETYE